MKKVIKFVKGKKEDENAKITNTEPRKSLPESTELAELKEEDFLTNDKSITKVHRAVWSENTDKLRSVMKTHDIDITDKLDRTALYFAVLKRNASMCTLLLEHGANQNIPDIDGVTPFLKAVQLGAKECASVLLESSADLKRTDKDLNNSLHYAVAARDTDLLALLLDHSVDCNLNNARGETPLLEAVRLGEVVLAEPLLSCGADVNSADSGGVTPLMAAANAGRGDIVALLLAHHADPDLKDAQGKTAAELASSGGFKEIALKLRNASLRAAHINNGCMRAAPPLSSAVPVAAAVLTESNVSPLSGAGKRTPVVVHETDTESEASARRSENGSPQSGVIPPPCKPLRSLEYLQAGRQSCGEDKQPPVQLLTLGTVRSRHISITEHGEQPTRTPTPHRYSYQGDPGPDLVAYCEDRQQDASTGASDDSLPMDEQPPPIENRFLQEQFSILEDYEKKKTRSCAEAGRQLDDIADLLEDNKRINAQLERYASKSRSLPRTCQSSPGRAAGSMSLPRTLDSGKDFIRDMKRYGSFRPRSHMLCALIKPHAASETITSSKKYGFIDKLKIMFGKRSQIHLGDSTDVNNTWLHEKDASPPRSGERPRLLQMPASASAQKKVGNMSLGEQMGHIRKPSHGQADEDNLPNENISPQDFQPTVAVIKGECQCSQSHQQPDKWRKQFSTR